MINNHKLKVYLYDNRQSNKLLEWLLWLIVVMDIYWHNSVYQYLLFLQYTATLLPNLPLGSPVRLHIYQQSFLFHFQCEVMLENLIIKFNVVTCPRALTKWYLMLVHVQCSKGENFKTFSNKLKLCTFLLHVRTKLVFVRTCQTMSGYYLFPISNPPCVEKKATI